MSKTKSRKARYAAAKEIVRQSASGAAGGYLVGRSHSKGGIKVINKSDPNRPIEVEGNEAVITAPALSDNTLHEFEGKKMTKRQILSAINVDAGGVAFADGGRIKKKMKVRYSDKKYKFGGKVMSGKDIVNDCGCQHKMMAGGAFNQSDEELAEKYYIIQSLKPILIPNIDINEHEAKQLYRQLPNSVNIYDHYELRFVTSTFGKFLSDKRKHLIFITIPYLSQLADLSIPIFYEKHVKPKHENAIEGFFHYAHKINVDGDVYYVRITAQQKKPSKKIVLPNEIHALFVSDIEINKAENVTVSPRSFYMATNTHSQPVLDTKLQNWLEKAKAASLKFNKGGKFKKAEDSVIHAALFSPPIDNNPRALKGKQLPIATDFTQSKGEFPEDTPSLFGGLGSSAASKLAKGGDMNDKLLADLSKVKLSPGYSMYQGHPEELLRYVQDQATGLDETRKHVSTGLSAYRSISRMIGSKDLVLLCVAALPQKDKDKVIKAWKGKALDPELRKALRKKTMAEGGQFGEPEKISNFTSKGISHEVQHILSENGGNREKGIIKATAGYLRTSKTASANGFNKNLWKQEEKHFLLKYIDAHNLWVENIWNENYISEGAEQKVYLYDSENVVKFNDGVFYSSWLEYLNSLLLHNYYFPPTAYSLIGFLKKDNILFAVVKQPFIQGSPLSDTEIVKSFLSANGFNKKKNTKANDYYNPKTGVILEDLHEGNVLIKDGIPYFIDTVFFITDEDGEIVQFETGGTIGDRKTISLPSMEHIVGNSRAYQHYKRGGMMAKGGKIKNDTDIWLSVDGGDPITYSEFHKDNTEEGVTMPEEDSFEKIKNLKMGEEYRPDFHSATVKRVPPPKYLAKGAKIKKKEEDIKGITPGHIQRLRKFVPSFQVEALVDILVGEEREYAVEVITRLLHTFDTMPKTYQTESQETNDKIIHLHYFYGGMDWYIVERDSEPVQYQAFGYANLGDDENAEWGYISIVELMQTNKVEIDFNWTPITFGQLKGEGKEEDVSSGPSEDQRWLKILKKYSDKSVVAPLSAYKQKVYDENEEDNNHTENLVLLAKATENGELIEVAELILSEQEKLGHFPSDYNELRNKLSDIIKIERQQERATISEIAAANPGRIIIASVSGSAPAAKQKASTTAKQQTGINEQIRKLVKEKGADRSKYSAEEISLLKLYEGAGAEKATTTDVRILDQFFTPMDIVAKMWGIAIKHGFTFKGTSVLEPSVGSGRFLQYIPLPSKDVIVSVDAYDVDETCVTICKVLYPFFNIGHGSFESLFFRGRTHIGLAGVSKFYDLVIGNPPYREYVSEYAPLGEKKATDASTFEMYFITRGVDVLKPGGLLIYIIPNTFLSNDNKYNGFKEKLAKKCTLIDAYRLPNGVFDSTEVGTDIICLKKL